MSGPSDSGLGDPAERASTKRPRVLVSMPPELYADLQRQAEAEDRPVSRIVREAIRRYLDDPRGARRG